MTVTLNDIAARCGVSRATVSLVLQDSSRVSLTTKQRVRLALKEMNYVYDRRAANLRGQRTFSLGLVLTDVRNPALADLAMAAERTAAQASCVVMMGYTQDVVDRQDQLLRSMIEHRLDGVILSAADQTTAQDLDTLVRSKVPHVLVTRRVLNMSSDYAGPDNATAGRLIADHLVGQGARSLAFLGGSVRVSAHTEREAGLRSQWEQRGLTWDPALSLRAEAGRDGGVHAVRALLAAGPLPDAIVAYSDAVAQGLISELANKHIIPGRDVAIASFDNSPDAPHVGPDGLTSVDTFMSHVGREAMALLLRNIDEAHAEPVSLLLQPELHVRGSTANWRPRPSG